MSTFRALLPVVAFALLAAPVAHAQDDPADDLKARAEAIGAKLHERLQHLDSYEDTVEMRFDIEMSEAAEGFMDGSMFLPQAFELAMEAPNKVAFEYEQITIYCDGETMWISMPMFGQYIEQDAPDTWADIFLAPEAEMFIAGVAHPVVQSLLRDQAIMDPMNGEWHDVASIETVEHTGVKATHIKGTYEMPQVAMMGGDPFHYELWINDETGLLMEWHADYTELYNTMMENMGGMYGMEEDDEEEDKVPPYTKFKVTLTVDNVRVNADIPDSRFAFEADDNLELVDAFRMPGMGPDQQIRLVGNEAPDFTLHTLDGEELSLSDLRGNVVLLDFWATWCAPCVQALPHIQEIHEHFQGKPVVVLGVNRDQPGMDDRVKALLEEKEITFGHVMDADGTTALEFHVRGIPSTILIDAEGIVQDVGTGFMPGKEKKLIENIDTLLAGERLYDPEDIAEQVAALGEYDEEDYSGASFFQDSEKSRELRESITEDLGTTSTALHQLDLPRGVPAYSWQLQVVNVEGDGTEALVIPQGKTLHVVRLDGSGAERINLRGVPGYGQVQWVTAIGTGDDLNWLASSIVTNMSSRTAGLAISMHERSGEVKWTFAPDLAESAQAHSPELTLADLDGDGRDEIIVPFQAMVMDDSNTDMMMPSAQSSHVLVLDLEGALLAHHSAGNIVYGVKIVPGPDGKGHAILCLTDGKPIWLELRAPTKQAGADGAGTAPN